MTLHMAKYFDDLNVSCEYKLRRILEKTMDLMLQFRHVFINNQCITT